MRKQIQDDANLAQALQDEEQLPKRESNNLGTSANRPNLNTEEGWVETQAQAPIYKHISFMNLDKEIRLLRLECVTPQARGANALCGTLMTVRQSEAPKYRAVSYTWGEGPSDRPLLIWQRESSGSIPEGSSVNVLYKNGSYTEERRKDASSAADPRKIEMLGSMGFDIPQARKALKETSGDIERAVEWLFNHPDELGDFEEDTPANGSTVKELLGQLGDSNDPHWVTFHSPQRMMISATLDTALRKLFLKELCICDKCTIYIWVDSICIDQQNNEEQSFQVRKMDQIYKEAFQTCVWLGDSDEDSERAFQLMKGLEEILDKAEEKVLNFQNVQRYVTMFEKETEHKKDLWHAFANLLNRPLFLRRWIIQEVVLSKEKNIACGNRKVRWTCFCIVFTLLMRVRKAENIPIPEHAVEVIASLNMCTDVNEGYGNQTSLTLDILLEAFRTSISTNPKDSVYSLLSMASDVTDNNDTYIQTIQMLFRSSKSLSRQRSIS
jgi:hypothetical protein